MTALFYAVLLIYKPHLQMFDVLNT